MKLGYLERLKSKKKIKENDNAELKEQKEHKQEENLNNEEIKSRKVTFAVNKDNDNEGNSKSSMNLRSNNHKVKNDKTMLFELALLKNVFEQDLTIKEDDQNDRTNNSNSKVASHQNIGFNKLLLEKVNELNESNIEESIKSKSFHSNKTSSYKGSSNKLEKASRQSRKEFKKKLLIYKKDKEASINKSSNTFNENLNNDNEEKDLNSFTNISNCKSASNYNTEDLKLNKNNSQKTSKRNTSQRLTSTNNNNKSDPFNEFNDNVKMIEEFNKKDRSTENLAILNSISPKLNISNKQKNSTLNNISDYNSTFNDNVTTPNPFKTFNVKNKNDILNNANNNAISNQNSSELNKLKNYNSFLSKFKNNINNESKGNFKTMNDQKNQNMLISPERKTNQKNKDLQLAVENLMDTNNKNDMSKLIIKKPSNYEPENIPATFASKNTNNKTIQESLQRVDDKKAIAELIQKKMFSIMTKTKEKKKSYFKTLKVSQYWAVLKIVFRTCKFFNDLKDNIRMFGTEREVNIFYNYTLDQDLTRVLKNSNRKFTNLDSNISKPIKNSNNNSNSNIDQNSLSFSDSLSIEINKTSSFKSGNINKSQYTSPTKTNISIAHGESPHNELLRVKSIKFDGLGKDLEQRRRERKRNTFKNKITSMVNKKMRIPWYIIDINGNFFKKTKIIRNIHAFCVYWIIPLFIAYHKPFNYNNIFTILGIYIDFWFFFEFIIKFFYSEQLSDKKVSCRSILREYVFNGFFILKILSAFPFFLINDFILNYQYIDFYKDVNHINYINGHPVVDINKSYKAMSIIIHHKESKTDFFMFVYIYKIIYNIVGNINTIVDLAGSGSILLFFQELFKIKSSIVIIIDDLINSLLLMHFFACIFLKIGFMNDSERNWITTLNGNKVNDFPTYLGAFYFSATSLTKVGYGDITPYTNSELIAVKLWLVIASIYYSMIISKLTIFVLRFNSNKTKTNMKLQIFNHFCNDSKFDKEIKSKLVREYTNFLNKKKDTENIFNDLGMISENFNQNNSNNNNLDKETSGNKRIILANLPIELKCEVVYNISKDTINKIYFFNSQDTLFVATMFPLLKSNFSLKDYVFYKIFDIPLHIYFLLTGKVIFNTKNNLTFKIIREGLYFGDIEVFYKIHRICSTVAFTNCSYLTLNKKFVFEIIEKHFPIVFNEMMNNASLKLEHDIKIFRSREIYQINKRKEVEQEFFTDMKTYFNKKTTVSSSIMSINNNEFQDPNKSIINKKKKFPKRKKQHTVTLKADNLFKNKLARARTKFLLNIPENELENARNEFINDFDEIANISKRRYSLTQTKNEKHISNLKNFKSYNKLNSLNINPIGDNSFKISSTSLNRNSNTNKMNHSNTLKPEFINSISNKNAFNKNNNNLESKVSLAHEIYDVKESIMEESFVSSNKDSNSELDSDSESSCYSEENSEISEEDSNKENEQESISKDNQSSRSRNNISEENKSNDFNNKRKKFNSSYTSESGDSSIQVIKEDKTNDYNINLQKRKSSGRLKINKQSSFNYLKKESYKEDEDSIFIKKKSTIFNDIIDPVVSNNDKDSSLDCIKNNKYYDNIYSADSYLTQKLIEDKVEAKNENKILKQKTLVFKPPFNEGKSRNLIKQDYNSDTKDIKNEHEKFLDFIDYKSDCTVLKSDINDIHTDDKISKDKAFKQRKISTESHISMRKNNENKLSDSDIIVNNKETKIITEDSDYYKILNKRVSKVKFKSLIENDRLDYNDSHTNNSNELDNKQDSNIKKINSNVKDSSNFYLIPKPKSNTNIDNIIKSGNTNNPKTILKNKDSNMISSFKKIKSSENLYIKEKDDKVVEGNIKEDNKENKIDYNSTTKSISESEITTINNYKTNVVLNLPINTNSGYNNYLQGFSDIDTLVNSLDQEEKEKLLLDYLLKEEKPKLYVCNEISFMINRFNFSILNQNMSEEEMSIELNKLVKKYKRVG